MYRYFDSAVSSDCHFPELAEVEGVDSDIEFELRPALRSTSEHDWFHRWHSDPGKTKIGGLIARETDGFRLRYPDLADFLINSRLNHVACEPLEGVPADTLRHLFLDDTLPRVFAHRGQMIVHASAVQSPSGKGLAFLGESGRGKSTIASSFYIEGYRLLTDDCLKISVIDGRLIGVTAYSGSRLKEDSADYLFSSHVGSVRASHYSDKKRIALPVDEHCCAVGIDELFLLGEPDIDEESPVNSGIELQELNGAEAIMRMIKRSFLLDVEDMAVASRQFEMAREVLFAAKRIFSLSYPHDYGLLGEIMERVENPPGSATDALHARPGA
jgi:hypothetical protein